MDEATPRLVDRAHILKLAAATGLDPRSVRRVLVGESAHRSTREAVTRAARRLRIPVAAAKPLDPLTSGA